MEYKVIGPEHYDNVIKHLRMTFFSDEPLNKAVKLCRPGEGHDELEKHCLNTVKDDISLMAVDASVDGGQIAGVILNGILRPGETEEALKSLVKSDDEKFVKILELIYRQILKADLFNCFNVDRIFDVRILSVDGRYRGQGVAKELVRRSELLAQTYRFRLLKADATGIFSQKILRTNGFEMASEQLYAKYKDKNDQLILPVEAPHLKLQLLIKHLRNCDNEDGHTEEGEQE
ncbi:arylalkylamine N-acetyltransferase 1 [Drosophila tropicalis]|uniref:arylalkylamine N-acetyltransferase 1 n=1 Tax=Drosophila tropicalis TaxID=46794 RepID=UPI0035ABE24C